MFTHFTSNLAGTMFRRFGVWFYETVEACGGVTDVISAIESLNLIPWQSECTSCLFDKRIEASLYNSFLSTFSGYTLPYCLESIRFLA